MRRRCRSKSESRVWISETAEGGFVDAVPLLLYLERGRFGGGGKWEMDRLTG